MTRPPFPSVLDASLISTFRACPQKAFLEYVQHWKPKSPSIHLHAGKAYASALEATRRAFYLEGKSSSESAEIGLGTLLREYGDFECPEDSAKSASRMAGALEFYLHSYPLESDAAVPVTLPDGGKGIEVGFAEPLPINHPETGDPLIYTGRLDMMVNYAGAIYGLDDKTTSSLGASWSKQWEMRCFSEDTEVLTNSGWKKICDLEEMEEIAQWNQGLVEFVVPSDVHSTRTAEGTMVQISGQKVEQLVTPNHRMHLNLRRGGARVVLAGDLLSQDAHHSIPTAGILQNEVALPDAFQKYLVATQADGSLQYSKGRVDSGQGHREHMPFPATRFTFVKRRKYERLIEILAELGAKWTEQIDSAGRFIVHISGFEPCQEHLMLCLNEKKEFNPKILPMITSTFVNELQYWDGWASQYYTTSKHNADFVQTAAHCQGLRGSVKKKVAGTVSYVVVISDSSEAKLQSLSIKRVPYEGNVWCLSVPSSFLLVRRNGVISVSGNSQFTGYCWGAARLGFPLSGFLVRGVSILKTKYDTQQALTYRPQWMIDRWFEQLNRDILDMIECWESGIWDYNLDASCEAYGGCPFKKVCLAADPENWLATGFERRRWDPVARTENLIELPS